MKGPRRWVPPMLMALAFLGFAVSLYLTYMHYRGQIPRCYVVQGCNIVQTSRYSIVLGVPTALLGTIFFTLMFYLGLALPGTGNVHLLRSYKAFAFLGALAAIPLLLVQAVVLRAFCSYCLVTDITLLALWVGSLLLPPPARGREAQASPSPAR